MKYKSLLCLLLIVACDRSRGAVRISEFQTSNRDTVKDSFGDSSDWIEIQNPDAAAVNLAGYALTSDSTRLNKWVFPSLVIPARGHLLVWASGKNRTSGELHTNFNLPAVGGYLALLAPAGSVLSEFVAYPAIPEDRSYGLAFSFSNQTLIGAAADCRWTARTNALTGWQNFAFVDTGTGWFAAKTGIGYDNTTTPVNYLSQLGAGGNTKVEMFDQQRPGCFIRVPFQVADPTIVTSLTLNLKYDAGFAAWINGTRLMPSNEEETNAPNPLTNASEALVERADADALTFVTFDITAQKSALLAGANVLAIQGMNSLVTSSDFLIVPELSVRRVNYAVAPTTGFFVTPSPGSANPDPTVLGFVDAPDFSVKRGFYQTTQTVALSTNTLGATIRYTLDSSAPSSTVGMVYGGALSVSTSKVVRAVAYRAGWHPSAIKSHTYLFAEQIKNQPSNPAGFPSTWGNEFDYFFGDFDPDLPVIGDYRMHPLVTADPAYTAEVVPALTTTLPIVSIAGNVTDIFGLNGIYANGRLDGIELPASVEYFDPVSGDKFQEDAGLRIHGGNSPIDHPKKPFRLYFRAEYGPKKLSFPLFPGSKVTTFDKLQLRPGGHDGWGVPFGSGENDLARHATYIRDRFLRDTQLEMGHASVRGRYVHLYLNGLYWGVYDLHEVPSADFFSSHQGGPNEEWDVFEHSNRSDPSFYTVDGTDAAMTSLLAAVRPASRMANPSNYAAVQQYLDIDSYIDYMILQIWAAQCDWVGPVYRGVPPVPAARFFNKNWEVGRRSRAAQPGQMHWLVWDDEISMGSHLTNLVPNLRVLDFDLTKVGTPAVESGIPGTPGPPGEIYNALRQSSLFRIRFADRLARLFSIDGPMGIAKNKARLERLKQELFIPIVAESARWGDVNSGNPDVVTFTRNNHWMSELDWMRDTWIEQRNDIVLQQFLAVQLASPVQTPVIDPPGGNVPPQQPVNMTATGNGFTYYTLDGSDPLTADPAGNLIPSPNAQVFFEAFPLSASATVKVRIKEFDSWSALAEAQFIVGTAASATNVTISEFCYNPAITQAESLAGYTASDFEFIEIYNPTAGPVDFTGCHFDDGIEFDFNQATQKVLSAGGRMVLVANPTAFLTRFPSVVPNGTFAGAKNLSNTGERIELLSAAGPAIVDFIYSDAKPWPSAADGQGYSLVLRNAQMLPDPSLPGNWRLSLQPMGGTPGGVDSDAFAAWAQRTGGPSVLLADPDGNGHTAMEEYALGMPRGAAFGEPLRITPVLLDSEQWEFELEFPLNLAADDVRVLVQASDNLSQWGPATGLIPCPEGTPNAAGIQQMKWLTGPVPPGTKFFRLLLEK